MTDTTPRRLSDSEQHTWRDFLRMQRLLNSRLNRQLQADSELSLADFEVLVHLTEVAAGRLRVLELAKALQWEKSRMSHHAGRMERRGLITREECPNDKRGAFVVLTGAGREAIEAAAPLHVGTVRRMIFDRLTAEQIAALAEISGQVLAGLEQDSRALGAEK